MSTDFDTLRQRLTGTLTAPGDSGWDAARTAWNLAADQQPAAVVFAETAGDVAATLSFAREAALSVTPQATGHAALSLPPLAGTVLLRTERLTSVHIDPEARRARVGAGVRWGDVIAAATPHGLTALHGSSGGVGVVGYTLGGGIGWLARQYGLACNAVRAIEVVTADGVLRQVDQDAEPDLFWALRGGSGGYALVTGIEFDLVPLERAYAGSLMWPIARAAEVLAAYRDWAAGVPDTVSSSFRLMRFPPLPVVPELLRGQSLAVVTLASTNDSATAEDLVAPLRGVADPFLDAVAEVPAAVLGEIAGDPQDPVPTLVGGHTVLAELNDDAITALLDLAGPGVDVPLLQVELRQGGGALHRPGPGAAATLPGAFLTNSVGFAPVPEAAEAVRAAQEQMRQRLAPFSLPKTYLNFAEDRPGTRLSLPDEVADRLQQVKAEYDPDGVIVSAHAVG